MKNLIEIEARILALSKFINIFEKLNRQQYKTLREILRKKNEERPIKPFLFHNLKTGDIRRIDYHFYVYTDYVSFRDVFWRDYFFKNYGKTWRIEEIE